MQPDKTWTVLFKSGKEKAWTVKEGVLNVAWVEGRKQYTFVGRILGTTVDSTWTVYDDGIDAQTLS